MSKKVATIAKSRADTIGSKDSFALATEKKARTKFDVRCQREKKSERYVGACIVRSQNRVKIHRSM